MVRKVAPKKVEFKEVLQDTKASTEFESIREILLTANRLGSTDANVGRHIIKLMRYLEQLAKDTQEYNCGACARIFESETNNIRQRFGVVVHRECEKPRWYKRSSKDNRLIDHFLNAYKSATDIIR